MAVNFPLILLMIHYNMSSAQHFLQYCASRNELTLLNPHFYAVKLGFTGEYIIFHILLKNIVEAVLTSTHNLCFEQKYEKRQSFSSENFQFQFLEVKFSIYLNRRVFVMMCAPCEDLDQPAPSDQELVFRHNVCSQGSKASPDGQQRL